MIAWAFAILVRGERQRGACQQGAQRSSLFSLFSFTQIHLLLCCSLSSSKNDCVDALPVNWTWGLGCYLTFELSLCYNIRPTFLCSRFKFFFPTRLHITYLLIYLCLHTKPNTFSQPSKISQPDHPSITYSHTHTHTTWLARQCTSCPSCLHLLTLCRLLLTLAEPLHRYTSL